MMPALREAEAPAAADAQLTPETLARDPSSRSGKARSQSPSRQPGIVIKPWEPDTPYLKELRAAKAGDRFAVYMKNRANYGNSPAFFLDCADFFREQNQPDLALQVLSNIAELQLEDAALLRVLGYRLLQLDYLDLAAQTFQQVLDLRPEEPQSYRDLALTLARRAGRAAAERKAAPGSQPGQGEGRRDIAESVRADYSRAIDLWIQIVLKRWDNRFAEIELIALEELNHIWPKAKAAGVSDIPLDPRLIKLLDVDVRIVMTWHADNTDIDLWVTEPSGEKAF
jgi:tetratricopeptide (TPR) repeat protein